MVLNEKFAVVISMNDAAIFAHAIKENSLGLFDPTTGDVLKDPFIERLLPCTDVVLSLIGLARINSDMETIAKLNALQDLIEMYNDDPKNLDFVFDVAPVIAPEASAPEVVKPLNKFDRIKQIKISKEALKKMNDNSALTPEELEALRSSGALGTDEAKRFNDDKKAAEDLHAKNAEDLLNGIIPAVVNEVNNFDIPGKTETVIDVLNKKSTTNQDKKKTK